MLDRLIGLETEYAIRFSPERDSTHPGNAQIYLALKAALAERVLLAAGERESAREKVFMENGGAFCYEVLPLAFDGGLLEMATPECRGPAQLLTWQRAQERLLIESLPRARELLAEIGHPGELGLLKNCRDAEGHIYGAQENISVPIATGRRLRRYHLGVALLLPGLVLLTLIYLPLAIALPLTLVLIELVVLLVMGTGRLLLRALGRTPPAPPTALHQRLAHTLGRAGMALDLVLLSPIGVPFLALLRRLAFLRVRHALLAHLVSRPIYTGVGTLRDGRFELSEKATAITGVTRRTLTPSDRSIFDFGNLTKLLFSPLLLTPHRLRDLFRPVQRLQIGLSSSNMAQVAEYLKIGLTALLVEMALGDALTDAPRLARPIAALQTICADPDLQATVELADGETVTALEIQRRYLAIAQRWLKDHPTPSLETQRLLALWTEVLDALENAPAQLVGQVDWITKRTLLDSGELTPAAAKKLDLRYHELGTGYFAQLSAAGITRELVDAGQVERAMTQPPERSPAVQRAALLRALADSDETVEVAWDRARVGGRLRGKVIRFPTGDSGAD